MSVFNRLIAVILTIVLPYCAAAADRVALVIGMGHYQNITPLSNTLNDARGIAETLKGIGFDVTLAIDASSEDLRQILDDFAFRSEIADLALIYYAGHGVEVQGENFLIPVDANVTSNLDIQRQSVSLKQLLTAVDKARKMRVVILDSCRNNPFGDSINLSVANQAVVAEDAPAVRGSVGLAAPSPDRGTLVAFAARDGQVALDGTGTNSPYATALMEKLSVPGLEISLMFRQVRDLVLSETGNLQEPHTYGSLSGIPFYIAEPKDGQEAISASDPRQAWASIRPEQEQQLLALADIGDTRSMLGLAYIRLNPNEGRFDPASAVSYLERAAAAGSPEAQFELGKLYETGVGVQTDPARALALYQASAAQDFADAINDLGFLHFNGGLGLPADFAAALKYFERAADLRHPQAQFNFAALIDDGLVPSKGPKDAAHYLYESLRSGSADVLNLLGSRPNMFSVPTRKALQAELQKYKFYTGAIDGDFGPGTQRSIRAAYGIVE